MFDDKQYHVDSLFDKQYLVQSVEQIFVKQ